MSESQINKDNGQYPGSTNSIKRLIINTFTVFDMKFAQALGHRHKPCVSRYFFHTQCGGEFTNFKHNGTAVGSAGIKPCTYCIGFTVCFPCLNQLKPPITKLFIHDNTWRRVMPFFPNKLCLMYVLLGNKETSHITNITSHELISNDLRNSKVKEYTWHRFGKTYISALALCKKQIAPYTWNYK